MAVIATEHGGIGPSLGGIHRLPDGTSAVKALGWQEVDAIVEQVSTLNPYDRSVVPGSVLKSLGPDGVPCHQRSVGLLGRRPVVAAETIVIGKEANELEQVEIGLIDELEAVQTVYRRDRSEELREKLRRMPVKAAMALTGLSRRQVFYLRSGECPPASGLLSTGLIRSQRPVPAKPLSEPEQCLGTSGDGGD